MIIPKLSDYYDIPLLQSAVDFAIPFMDENIPIYVYPYLNVEIPFSNGLATDIFEHIE